MGARIDPSETGRRRRSATAGAPVADVLAELLSSKVRAAVLAHLLPRPHLGFSLTDLSRRLGLPISSLQHECYKLVRLGLLRDERDGAARRYRPDPASPLLAPLSALVAGAIGRPTALAAAAEGVPGLAVAALAEAAAGGPPTLLLVGSLPVEAIDELLARVAAVVAPGAGPAGIELAFFGPADWLARGDAGDPYRAELLGRPLLPMVGAPGVEAEATAADRGDATAASGRAGPP